MVCYYSDSKINAQPCVLALGNFDGVHKGHKQILESAYEYAKEKSLKFGVFTFDVHPRICANDRGFRLLLPTEEKIKQFEASGADFVFFEDFSKVKDFEKQEFVLYITEKLGAEAVFCGENFKYAKGASGDSKTLAEDMAKLSKKVFSLPLLHEDGQRVSSSRIRSLVEEGNVEKANVLLGHKFCIAGNVLHGNSIGHTIGFPTVNIKLSDTLVHPLYGVYASEIFVDGKAYHGVTNVGIKPTVSDDKENVLAETNIFNFDGDIYGKYIKVCLCKLLRSEKRFSGLDELKKAIDNDVENTKKYFGETDI